MGKKKREWSAETERQVTEVRQMYPHWGGNKLAVILRRRGISIEPALLARILRHLTRRGTARPRKLRDLIAERRRPRPRPAAKRKVWVGGSGAGPLLLLPARLLRDWAGAAVPTARPPGSPAARDYDRACAVGDVGTIRVGPGRGLVLGGDPLPTTWVVRGEGGLLVRWLAAEDETSLLARANRIPEEAWKSTRRRIELPGGPLVLFRAAASGDRVGRDSLVLRVPPGTYRIEEAVVHEPETSVLAYRLVRESERRRAASSRPMGTRASASPRAVRSNGARSSRSSFPAIRRRTAMGGGASWVPAMRARMRAAASSTSRSEIRTACGGALRSRAMPAGKALRP